MSSRLLGKIVYSDSAVDARLKGAILTQPNIIALSNCHLHLNYQYMKQ